MIRRFVSCLLAFVLLLPPALSLPEAARETNSQMVEQALETVLAFTESEEFEIMTRYPDLLTLAADGSWEAIRWILSDRALTEKVMEALEIPQNGRHLVILSLDTAIGLEELYDQEQAERGGRTFHEQIDTITQTESFLSAALDLRALLTSEELVTVIQDGVRLLQERGGDAASQTAWLKEAAGLQVGDGLRQLMAESSVKELDAGIQALLTGNRREKVWELIEAYLSDETVQEVLKDTAEIIRSLREE